MCGFANPLAFMKVTDDDIDFVEESIRDRALSLVRQQSDPKCEIQIEHERLVDIFGKNYASNPKNFHFERGDKVLIKSLIEHLKQIVENEGYVKFKFKMKTSKARPTSKKDRVLRPCGISKGKSIDSAMKGGNDANIIDETLDAQIDGTRYAELKSRLFQNVRECLKDYKFDRIVEFESIDDSIVDVYMDENNVNIYGGVVCIVCRDNQIKKKAKSNSTPKRGFYQETPIPCTWVLSNFHKHLTNVHKLESTKATQLKCTKKNSAEKELNENSIADISEICEEEEVYVEVFNDDESSTVESVGTNKDQDTDRLYTQFAAQITIMITETLSNSDGTEPMQFHLDKNVEGSLTVANVAPDGNCLIGSLVHQIFHHPLGSEIQQTETTKLRAQIVEHILKPENFEAYKFTLQNYVYESKESNEIEDMTAECQEYVRTVLANEGEWAGAEAIHAASDIHKVNVIVFIENDIFYMHSENATYEKTIAIAYRLGHFESGNRVYNHYDSVCEVESDVAYAVTNTLMEKKRTQR